MGTSSARWRSAALTLRMPTAAAPVPTAMAPRTKTTSRPLMCGSIVPLERRTEFARLHYQAIGSYPSPDEGRPTRVASHDAHASSHRLNDEREEGRHGEHRRLSGGERPGPRPPLSNAARAHRAPSRLGARAIGIPSSRIHVEPRGLRRRGGVARRLAAVRAQLLDR